MVAEGAPEFMVSGRDSPRRPEVGKVGKIGKPGAVPGPVREGWCEGCPMRLFCLVSRRRGRGDVAQLGERLNGIQEADGSIPFSSTEDEGPREAAWPFVF